MQQVAAQPCHRLWVAWKVLQLELVTTGPQSTRLHRPGNFRTATQAGHH